MAAKLTASDLIRIAEHELGYLEKKSNSQLEVKTANAGSANYTKYGAWYGMDGQAWCAMFVSWCFAELAGGKAGAKKMLCGGLYASCTTMYNAFKKAGRVHSEPQPGDIIVFNQKAGSTTMSHTGIVTKITGSRVYTIEGNTGSASGVVANGGGVAAKSYSLSYNRIGGYLRPVYTDDSGEKAAVAPAGPGKSPTVKVSISTYLVKKGHTGGTVRALQAALNGNGYDCGEVDGDFGAKTDEALRKYQRAKGLTADGIAGKDTWNKLMGG